MLDRKKFKKEGIKQLGRNYFIYFMICLIASIIGVKYVGTLAIINYYDFESPKEFSEKVVSSSPHLVEAISNLAAGESLEDTVDKVLDSLSEERERRIQTKKDKKILRNHVEIGVSDGIIGTLYRDLSSGTFLITILLAFHNYLRSAKLALLLWALLILFVVLLIWAFFINVYKVICARFFLEGRIYYSVQMSRCLFLYRRKCWCRSVRTMFILAVFYNLWSLTIVGRFIKKCSYFAVPYIVAENPKIGSLDAITLSRRMMDGHKMELFVFKLTFIGWTIINVLTIGLSGVFFSNPYREAALGEYYTYIRSTAVENKLEGTENLNDQYLFKKKGYEYPSYLTAESERRRLPSLEWRRDYSIQSLLVIFATISILGWTWEMIFHIFYSGTFINRGFLYGPWLPIYGGGALIVLTVLKPLRERAILQFFATFVLCGLVEYITGLLLEITHNGVRWWDYSGYFLNIDGRVCAEGLIFFAVGGMLVTYLVAPAIDNVVNKIKPRTINIFSVLFFIAFVFDMVTTISNPSLGTGVTIPRTQ